MKEAPRPQSHAGFYAALEWPPRFGWDRGIHDNDVWGWTHTGGIVLGVFVIGYGVYCWTEASKVTPPPSPSLPQDTAESKEFREFFHEGDIVTIEAALKLMAEAAAARRAARDRDAQAGEGQASPRGETE